MTSEGLRLSAVNLSDGMKLYYLDRGGAARNFMTEAVGTGIGSGQRRRLLPNFQMRQYSISADGRSVLFVASDSEGRTPCGSRRLTATPHRGGFDMDSWAALFGANPPSLCRHDEREPPNRYQHCVPNCGVIRR